MSFCSFKQIQSWVEGPCWWYLWWCGLALTPVDIMVQRKMSCQLMEELPVAAERSVATGATCVNLLPCHFFFCASTHPPLSPFISTFFSFPFRPRPPPRLHSLYPTLLRDKLLLAVDLLVVKSAPCADMKVGWASRRKRVHPPPTVPARRLHRPLVPHPYLTHVQRALTTTTHRRDVSVEIDILSHKISLD